MEFYKTRWSCRWDSGQNCTLNFAGGVGGEGVGSEVQGVVGGPGVGVGGQGVVGSLGAIR